MNIIDLSHTVTSGIPVYPGDPLVQIETGGVIAKDGYCDHKISFGSHVGTHVDAPAHMIDGGKQLKDYLIDRFTLSAVCIDATNGFSIKAINEANIREGDAVLFCTGASEYFTEERYWHDYQVLSDECCQTLIDKKVSMIGLDTGSADKVDGFPVHKMLLGADILIIENLTGLRQLIGKTFEFTALPLKLEKDGAPVRAIARING